MKPGTVGDKDNNLVTYECVESDCDEQYHFARQPRNSHPKDKMAGMTDISIVRTVVSI